MMSARVMPRDSCPVEGRVSTSRKRLFSRDRGQEVVSVLAKDGMVRAVGACRVNDGSTSQFKGCRF
jgi:hypothetical protein